VPRNRIPNLDGDGFYLRVAEALSGCQLVEQQLKLYISQALELVQKCLADKLPFKMSGDDYQNASLERLIRTFQKLTNNEALVAELNTFTDERNFLSHRAIAHTLDPDGELDYPTVVTLTPRLDAIVNESRRLQNAIHEEAHHFIGHLWFDDISDIS
jgi:hypothetical protein